MRAGSFVRRRLSHMNYISAFITQSHGFFQVLLASKQWFFLLPFFSNLFCPLNHYRSDTRVPSPALRFAGVVPPPDPYRFIKRSINDN